MWRVLFILNSLVVVIMASLAPFIFLLGDDQLVRYVMLCWKREETLLPCLCTAFCLNFCLRGSWCLAGALIDLGENGGFRATHASATVTQKSIGTNLTGCVLFSLLCGLDHLKKRKEKTSQIRVAHQLEKEIKVPRVTMQFYIWQSKRGLLLLLWQNFLYPNIASEKVIRNLPKSTVKLNDRRVTIYLGCISISDCCIWKISFFLNNWNYLGVKTKQRPHHVLGGW